MAWQMNGRRERETVVSFGGRLWLNAFRAAVPQTIRRNNIDNMTSNNHSQDSQAPFLWFGLVTKTLVAVTLLAVAMPLRAQFSQARRQYVEYFVTADHADRTYRTGESATIAIEACKGGNAIDSVTVYYRVGDEMFLPSDEDSTTFSRGHALIPLGTRSEPGFKACSLRFSVHGKEYRELFKVGFSPENIEPLTPLPDDFDEFWNHALGEAAGTDIASEITPLPHHSTDSVEVSLVKLTVGPGGRNMYGYLTKPRDGRKHPVLFCPPGAGASKIQPTTYYSERGYIYLNINIHSGCNPELDDEQYAEASKAAADYNRRGMAHRDSFYYRSVYAGCARCIDFLCTLPEWDGRNVGVTGGSQGGALAIVTAALQPKVTFCVPFYPALCDLMGFRHGRAGGWPMYFRNGDEVEGAERVLPYYDVANFARRLKCPVFFSFGYNDDTCSPTSVSAAYNVITSPKRLAVTPASGHWRYRETNDEAMEWMCGQWQ